MFAFTLESMAIWTFTLFIRSFTVVFFPVSALMHPISISFTHSSSEPSFSLESPTWLTSISLARILAHISHRCTCHLFFSISEFLFAFSINFTVSAIYISIRIFSNFNSVRICIAVLFTGVLCFLRGNFELICFSFFVCWCFFEELLQGVEISDRFLGKLKISDGLL